MVQPSPFAQLGARADGEEGVLPFHHVRDAIAALHEAQSHVGAARQVDHHLLAHA